MKREDCGGGRRRRIPSSCGGGLGAAGLDLPLGSLIRGIASTQSSQEREEAAAAYLLALAGQRRADHPGDLLAVAAMAARTRKELLGPTPSAGRGTMLERLAEVLTAPHPEPCVHALLDLASWYGDRARWAEARDVAEVARALARAVREPGLRVEVETMYGWLSLESGRAREALEAFGGAIALSRRRGLAEAEIRGELGVAHAHLLRGRRAAARRRAGRALARARGLGHAELVGLCGHTLLAVEQGAGDYERALEHGWNALNVVGAPAERASLLLDCGRLFWILGEPRTARRLIEAALREAPSQRERFQAEIDLLELEVVEGNELGFLARAKALARSGELAELPALEARFRLASGRALRVFGRPDAAEQAFLEAARLAEENGLPDLWVEAEAEWDALAGAGGEAGIELAAKPTPEVFHLARKFGGAELG